MPENGTLVVQVYTSRTRIPIPDATVTVTQPGDGKGRRRLVSVQVTDENGRTAPVTLATPPASDSTAPGTARAFTTCEVRVEHPDFDVEVVEGLQIFSGVRTLLEAELVPLSERANPQTSRRLVRVTPQTL